MPQDPDIPLPNTPESPRAVYQALAERTGVLAPGSPLSDELLEFAEQVTRLARGGGLATQAGDVSDDTAE
jgi:formate dehydrogenase maturation protein FdhE